MIHIDFANLEEMMAFSRQLLGLTEERTAAEAARPEPVCAKGPSEDQPGQAPRGAVTAVPRGPEVTAPHVPATPAAASAASAVPVSSSGGAPTAPIHAPGAAPAPAAASPVPTSAKEYTVDDLARAAIPLLDAGGQQALLNLLAQFGVQGIPQLSKDQYGAFATALRGLGAKI